MTCTFPFYLAALGLERMRSTLVSWPGLVFYGVMWTTLLVAAKYGNGTIRWLFSRTPIRWLGAVSYSLYLFHIPIRNFVVRSGSVPHALQLVAFLGASFLVAALSFLIFERPLSRIRLRRVAKSP